jgi:hypothetical protein
MKVVTGAGVAIGSAFLFQEAQALSYNAEFVQRARTYAARPRSQRHPERYLLRLDAPVPRGPRSGVPRRAPSALAFSRP